mgnify:CR=1 FL=1
MKVQIVVQFDSEASPNERVRVAGPLEDKILCLGLMAIAMRIVQDFIPQASNIAIPKFVVPSGRG